MKLKELGNTGQLVSSIGQGCMGIGGEFEKILTWIKNFFGH